MKTSMKIIKYTCDESNNPFFNIVDFEIILLSIIPVLSSIKISLRGSCSPTSCMIGPSSSSCKINKKM